MLEIKVNQYNASSEVFNSTAAVTPCTVYYLQQPLTCYLQRPNQGSFDMTMENHLTLYSSVIALWLYTCVYKLT